MRQNETTRSEQPRFPYSNTQELLNLFLKRGKVILDGVPDKLEVESVIAVSDNVSEANNTLIFRDAVQK